MLFITLQNLKIPDVAWHESVGLEIRLDLLDSWDFENLAFFLRSSKFPCMLTIRSNSHGGRSHLSSDQRYDLLKSLLVLKPQFLDIEIDLGDAFIEDLIKNAGNTQIVLSYHDISPTVLNLDELVRKFERFRVSFWKIAITLDFSVNALKLLVAKLKYPKLSLICMGERVSFTRVLGFVFENFLNYTYFEEKIAPGQISFQELRDIYHYEKISKDTPVYALIGDPVFQSIGHIFHNQLFQAQKSPNVYVKIPLAESEISSFFQLLLKLPIYGLSVTMPWKEKVISYVDELCPISLKIGCVNTIKICHGKILAANFDGIGAISAIEQHTSLLNKSLIILGAGGTAKAIVFAALEKGAKVFIWNRSPEKAKLLAEMLGATFLEKIPNLEFDIAVSSLPMNVSFLLPEKFSAKIAFDVNYLSKDTLFLQQMQKKGSKSLHGMQMFINQALKQNMYWQEDAHSGMDHSKSSI